MRTAWFAAGAAAGVYGMVKVRRIAEALTPDGMRDRLNAAFVGARVFRDELVQGQSDAEARLRVRYDGAGAPRNQLSVASPAPPRAAVLAAPDHRNHPEHDHTGEEGPA